MEMVMKCCESCGHESYGLSPDDTVIGVSRDIWELVHDLSRKKTEMFEVLTLDSRNRVLLRERVAQGSANVVHVSPIDIMRPTLLTHGCSFICVHNHPSGDITPSPEDRRLTEQILKASNLMGIRFLDHIIVGESSYYSFSDGGEL